MGTTTTNYGYNVPVGSDNVNLLPQMAANFPMIDADLKGVSDSAIGRATELLTGTVHALTRVDTDRDYFAFTATANFTAGDTFTLDGAQVSALTPDGQQLATGSYIIGSEVLVLVKDTLLTFILSPTKARDADLLDGHDSSYFATASDLTNTDDNVTALSAKVGSATLTTQAPDCSGAINELNSSLTELQTFGTEQAVTIGFTPNKDGFVTVRLTPNSGQLGIYNLYLGSRPFYTSGNDIVTNTTIIRAGETITSMVAQNVSQVSILYTPAY